MWDACFAGLRQQHQESPEELSASLRDVAVSRKPHVTPYAKGRAFALLKQHAPDATLDARTLMSVGLAIKQEGDKAAAADLLQKALAAGPREREKPSLLFNLLSLQAGAGSSPQEAQATYDLLKEYEADSRQTGLVTAGLYRLAQAYAEAEDYGRAVELLSRSRKQHTSDKRVQHLLARCQQALTAAGADKPKTAK